MPIRPLNIISRRKPHFRRGLVPKRKKILESVSVALTVPKGANAMFYSGIGWIIVKCPHPDAEALKNRKEPMTLANVSGNIRSHKDKICQSCQDSKKGCYEYLPWQCPHY